MALTKHQVATIKDRGRYGDGKGLYLQIMPTGARSWILRYERGGRERWMGLGPVDDFPLDEARERASKARRLLKDGFDPIDARRAELAKQATEEAQAAAKNITFKAAAEQCFKFHSPKWKNAKHRAQFLSTLKQYAYPALGRLPVVAIDKTLVLRAVQPIWEGKNETASRVRGRIEAVLDFARVNGWRDGDNPAAWDGNLVHVLPAPGTFTQVKHHAALPFVQIHDFMTQLATRDGIAAKALQFTILTAARTGDIIGNDRDDKPPMRWPHVDFKTRVWTVPSTKTETEHRVPLSDSAIKLLNEMKELGLSGDVVFGTDIGEPLSNMAMSTVIRRINADRTARGLPRYVDPKQHDRDATVHGFRSTFRDWAGEATSYPNHVVEKALAHAISNKVEAAYRRGDLLPKRVPLMNDWAKYCATQPVETTDNVIQLHGQGA
jgi:integrase